MKGFVFDLQRFDTQVIPAGETFTADGVTYTAVDDAATLSLDDGKVSGIEGGKVQAVVTSAENSPKVTFDASDGAINFTAASDGKVISITPFPIEFIAGEFTYKGNTLDITAGSDLAITTQSGDFILRNENHFDYDSTYTFTSTAMISDAERVISLFRLTNGSDVRQLRLEQLGKVINTFAERGVTLVKGSSEVLNIGDYKLTATAEKADAGLNFELGEAGMTFVPNTGDGTLNVVLSRAGNTIFGGELECTNGSITFGYDHAVTFAKDTSFNFTTKNNSVLTVTAADEATTNIALTDNGITFTPGSGDGGLNIIYSKKGKQVFEGSLNITDGTITFNPEEKKFSFTDGTKMQLGMWNVEFGIEVVGDTTVGSGIGASFKIDADENGNFIFTPDENGGSFNLSLKRDGTTPLQNTLLMTDSETDDDAFFENNVTVNGPIMFNPETGLLTLKDGTEIVFTFKDNNYTLTATADGDASSTISLTENGISITPEIGDGKLELTLGSKNGSMSVDIEVLSGGFLFGENGALNVVEGTELQLTFSDEYSVKFKTTDAAGGSLKLGEDGLTFTPNAEDGNLELTVTRGDETRTASLDVTGSITYKLDGSISLAEGTVVKNIFEDGNVLTITANTDASGSIVFHPQNGLTITPSTAEALNVLFTSGDTEVFNITSISGSVNYKGGVITASDGTEVLFTNYYMESEMKLSTSGGSSSLEITEDSTSYIANDGATFVLDYQDKTTLEITGGKFIDDYEHAIVTAGSIFKTNDNEDYFYLETAGDYTLNGMKVTTTADNTPVMLSDYKTITVDGISYTPLDENVTLTIDDGVTTCAGGKVSMQAEGFSEVFSCDTTDGAISYDSSANKFSVKTGAKSYLENFSDQFVAKSDFDITLAKNSDGTFTFSTDDSAAFVIERNGTAIMSSTMTLDGSIVANPSNNQITVPKDTLLTMSPDGKLKLEIKALDDAGGQLTLVDGGIRFAPNENDGALEFNFVNSERKVQLDVTGAFTYKGLGALSLEDGTEVNLAWEDGNTLKLTSSGSTGAIGIDPTKGLKITSDDEKLDLELTMAYGYSTKVSGLKGSLWYKEGTVTLEEGTKLTGTGTLGNQTVNVSLETTDGDAYLDFSTSNGFNYGAGTGKLKVTYALGDLKSTFTVNSGSVLIGHNLFQIAEGTDLETDLKDFIPALNFTTGEAGTYTINGQTITTSAEGLALTATDDYMSFKTSDDVVSYEGMTFAGNGNVSLKPDIVVLGKNVEATGFGEGNSFMLAESGNVTADAKIFELSSLENKLGEEIPLNVSVEGAEDGFIFSRTITRESEDNFDDPDYDNVGKVFTEKFIVHGDDSYRTRTDPIGLEEVIGISKDSTIEGGAILGDEVSPSYYDLVTDTNGKFTIGKNTYTIADDTQVGVVLTARFNGDSAYASAVKNLNGTISGNFSDGGFRVNGNDSLNVYDDEDISIISGGKKYEILGLDNNASLQVSAAGTYSVNSTAIAAQANDIIIGLSDGSAHLYHDNFVENTLSNTNVFGTENDDYIINSGTAVTVETFGGNDYIANNVDSSLVAAELGNYMDAGDGNDTLYSYHSYNPTLLGGNGTDSVVVSHGHLTYADGGEGNDTILGIAPDDGEHEDNWGMGGHATVLGGNGNDYIDVGYSNDSSIDGGAGNDTIIGSGKNATISGGDGKNLIKITNVVEDAGEYIVFSGDTTVQGFKTGFGEGSDTIYIPGDPAAVDFKSGGLTFYGDNDSLTLSNVNKTAKVNLFHEKRDVLNKGVFIAEGDWYKVKDSDLTVNAGEEVYFVGPSASPKRGVDFSGISSDLNVTMDTAYVDSEDYVPTTMWINGVYSIKGGAGLTTITGSDKSDSIINGAGNTTIDAKGGDDLISLTSSAALIEYAIGDGNDSIVGFNANSTLSISGGKYSTSKSGNDLVLTVGDEAITIFGTSNANVIGERNVPVEELTEMFGDKLMVAENTSQVELGDDDAAVAVYDEDSAVDILGGKGNDTLIALGSAPITFDMSAGGADKIALVTANQNITLEGYDAANGGGIATGNLNRASMVKEIMAGEDTRFGNGKIIIKTSEETQSLFTLAENASLKGSAIINFFDAHNRILPVGFTNQLGGSIDVSNSSDDYLLLGNYFGGKSGISTLLSGSGNDTLLGGGGDILDGGAGRNYIGLSETNDAGATIILSGGKNTVDNFNATFDDGDRISVDAANFDLKFDGENVNVKSDKAKAVLQNISSDDGAARILTVMNGDEIKAAVAQENGTITVGDDAADLYVGNKSGVDFTGFEDTLSADLSDAEHFRGINQLAAGDGISTLIGDSARNTLIAGTSDTSIWSGAGRDFMQGNSSADKSGSTSFLFLEGDGRDTVGNFEFLTQENSFTADKIDTGDYDIKDAFIAGDRVVVKLYDDSCLLINDAVGKDFRINDLIAKVDKNISYDGLANCYVAAGGSSLTVDSTVESAEIWLDNSHDTTFIGNIRTLDASAVKGNTSLVGNEFDNTIIAGQGDSSLWGGSSTSNDVLIGGAGKNSFFYLQGNGCDTVQSVKDGDEIILDNINLDQILDANISAAGVNLNFTDGGSLTINGTADVTYQLADGSKYSANHESLEWVSK